MFAQLLQHSRRLSTAAVVAGVGGSVALAMSFGVSLSSFTATITNSQNTAAVAALAISETSGGTTCNSYDGTATCAGINKYGGTTTPLVPGGSQSTTVTFTNTGTVAVGTSTLKGGTCTASTRSGVTAATTPSATNTDPSNLCSVLNLQIYKGSTALVANRIFNDTLAAFQTSTANALGALAVGAQQDYTFIITLPSSATTAIQGQSVSQPIVWTFNQ